MNTKYTHETGVDPMINQVHRYCLAMAALITAFLILAVRGQAQETAPITPRQAAPKEALSELKQVEAETARILVEIASLGPMLAEAKEAYRNNPCPETSVALMEAMTNVAALGAPGCEEVSHLAHRASRASSGLATRCSKDAQAMTPAIDRARRLVEQHHDNQKSVKGGLLEFFVNSRSRGITNEVGLAHSERIRLGRLLTLFGASRVAQRFLHNEAEAESEAREILLQQERQFRRQSDHFAAVAQDQQSLSETFRLIAATTARKAKAMVTTGKYADESATGNRTLQNLLAATAAFTREIFGMEPTPNTSFTTSTNDVPTEPSTGVWERGLRLVGLED